MTHPSKKDLAKLADDFDASTFDWETVKPFGLLCHCARTGASKITCGKLLAHCIEKVDCFRNKIEIRHCVFKIGVTHNPVLRYQSCHEKGYTEMWLLATSTSADLIHMLKAALICQYCLHVGCRDRKGSGGEGFPNRNDAPPGPYYAYIVEPEQTNTVGWGDCAGLSLPDPS